MLLLGTYMGNIQSMYIGNIGGKYLGRYLQFTNY